MAHHPTPLEEFLQTLRHHLGSLPHRHQIACAVCRAERLYPWYDALTTYLGVPDGQSLRNAIDKMWNVLLKGKQHSKYLAGLPAKICELTLGEEGCSILRAPAMDALGAALSAAEAFRADNPTDKAIAAAEAVVNRVDGEIMASVWQFYDRPIDKDLNRVIAAQAALNPTMKEELRRLHVALEMLGATRQLNDGGLQQLKTIAAHFNS